ncbi:MAG: ATP-dependent DNA helicase RecG, partial [Oscillospiraceae bacterium]|nr:ATP-dependent DNA helicase RecG [Oscillospiraceae bacterium]
MSSSPDIQYIKGVGPSKARLFNKLGIFSVGDLVSFYPRGYMDLSAPTPIDEAPLFTKACIKACIVNPAKLIKRYKGMEIYKAGAADDSGEITLIFFNQKYSALNLQTGRDYFFYGAVGGNLIKKELVNPYIEPCEGRCGAGLVPVYPTTSGLSQKLIRKTVLQALNEYDCQNTEVLREDVRMKYSLSQREYALHNIHNPKDGAALEMARKRLVFEDMLIFNGALQQIKKA